MSALLFTEQSMYAFKTYTLEGNSRALRRIRGVVKRVVQGMLRSDYQRVRGDTVAAVKAGVVFCESGWVDD